MKSFSGLMYRTLIEITDKIRSNELDFHPYVEENEDEALHVQFYSFVNIKIHDKKTKIVAIIFSYTINQNGSAHETIEFRKPTLSERRLISESDPI